MTLRIGSGSAWWGDRIEPARRNAEEGDLDYLCFETMAESTVSAAQIRARRDPTFGGYDTHLEERFRSVLPHCLRRGTRIVSNQGWVDPVAAAKAIRGILDELGVTDWPVAAITGNVITDRVTQLGDRIFETGAPLAELPGEVVSAEAYLGAEPIVAALREGARIVVTGRLADPALFLAPMMYEFGWSPRDAARLGQGAGIGHLMECGAQVTGGYFPDPGYKDVPRPWDLAFPIAEVEPDGSAIITKLPSGGVVNRETVLEQMFYEVHDPARYITPDVVVDFTTANVEDLGGDRVRVAGISGIERTPTLKVSIGVTEGWMGEDMFFYAGPGALGRAQLAETILRERFALVGLQAEDLRIDFLGVNAIHGQASGPPAQEPYEIVVRVAARTRSREEAEKIGREVDGMAVSGISATGKRVPFGERVREVIGIWSTLVPREAITPRVELF